MFTFNGKNYDVPKCSLTDFFKLISDLNISDEVTARADAEIEKIKNRNTKRKTSPKALAASAARDDFRAFVLSFLTDKPQATSEIVARMPVTETGEPESKNKVASALKYLVENDFALSRDDYKIGGKGAKKKGYWLNPDTAPAPDDGGELTAEEEAELSAEENAAGAEAYGGGV